MRKRILAAAAAIVSVAILMAGCANGKQQDMEKLLKQAIEQNNSAKSYHFSMDMEMDMQMMGQALEMDLEMDGAATADPVKMKADMKLDMEVAGQENGQDFAMLVYEKDGVCKSFLSMDGGRTWQESAEADMQEYDMQRSYAMYAENISSFSATEEELDGRPSYKVSGVLTGDSLAKVMKEANMMGSITDSVGMDIAGLAKDMMNDLKDMQIVIWLDRETGMISRMEMDMTEMMQAMMEKAMSAADTDIKVEKVYVDMRLFDYNSVEDIEIPQEAA